MDVVSNDRVSRCTCTSCNAAFSYYGDTNGGAHLALANRVARGVSEWLETEEAKTYFKETAGIENKTMNVLILVYGGSINPPVERMSTGAILFDENGLGVPKKEKWFNVDENGELAAAFGVQYIPYLVVIRDGREVTLLDVVFPISTESGQKFGVLDIAPVAVERKLGNIIKFSLEKSTLIIRMCWESIIDLIRGRYSLDAVSGPVGISGAIGDAAKKGSLNLLYLVAMISINLGVMNLLPIPALDGGRIIFILVEMISHRRLPKKIEDTINAVGLFVLLGLSFVIMVKDIFTIIG
jgi:Zn-dependent protease